MSADVDHLDHPRQTDVSNEIRRVWELIDPKQPILEIRAIKAKGATNALPPVVRHFRLDEYRDLDSRTAAFEELALELNERGYNLYTPFNPIRSTFRGPGGAKDADIECRTWILIDIDRRGDTSCPASEEELDAARAIARSIRDYLASLGWPPPLVMQSGNGCHLYFPLGDLENSEAVSAQIKRTLSGLANKFDTDVVGVDRVVHNAGRITKIPGTIARKGTESEGRPYRMARILDDL